MALEHEAAHGSLAGRSRPARPGEGREDHPSHDHPHHGVHVERAAKGGTGYKVTRHYHDGHHTIHHESDLDGAMDHVMDHMGGEMEPEGAGAMGGGEGREPMPEGGEQ